MPKNYTSPQGLKTFLGSIKSEIMDHRNRNQIPCNIPPEEIQALKELIQLQKDRIITIKSCDKGAGIIVLDFKEYMKAAYSHLNSQHTQVDGSMKKRFLEVDDIMTQKAIGEITAVLDKGLQDEIITQNEFNSMDPNDKDLARFYCNFKVHKTYEAITAPPPRPIVSGSGSMTESVSLFVQHHIKHISKTHASYLQDTPDFLRTIENINEGQICLKMHY